MESKLVGSVVALPNRSALQGVLVRFFAAPPDLNASSCSTLELDVERVEASWTPIGSAITDEKSMGSEIPAIAGSPTKKKNATRIQVKIIVSPVAAIPTIFPAMREMGEIEDKITSINLLDFSSIVFVISICVLIRMEMGNAVAIR